MEAKDDVHSSVTPFMGDLLKHGIPCTLHEIQQTKNPNPIILGGIRNVGRFVPKSSTQKHNVQIYHLKEVYSDDVHIRKKFRIIFIGDAAKSVHNVRLMEKDYIAVCHPTLSHDFSYKKSIEYYRRLLIVGLHAKNKLSDVYYKRKNMNDWICLAPNTEDDEESEREESDEELDENSISRNLPEKRQSSDPPGPSKKRKTTGGENADDSSPERCDIIELDETSVENQLHNDQAEVGKIPDNCQEITPSTSAACLNESELLFDSNQEVSDPENVNELSFSSQEVDFENLIESTRLVKVNAEKINESVTTVDHEISIASCPKSSPIRNQENKDCENEDPHLIPNNRENMVGISLHENNLEESQNSTVLTKWPRKKSSEEFTIETFLVTTLPPIDDRSNDESLLEFVNGYCDCCLKLFPITCPTWRSIDEENFLICPNCRKNGKIRNLLFKIAFEMILRDEDDLSATVYILNQYAENFLGCSISDLCSSVEARKKAFNLLNSCLYKEGKKNKLLRVKITPLKANERYQYHATSVQICED